MSDPVADMLTRIKNGYLARKEIVEVPHSKLKYELAQVLVKLNYIKEVEKKIDKNVFLLHLVYKNKKPAITEIKRVSKPGLRRYVGARAIPRVLGGLGKVILSTPKGLLTGKEALKQNVGGEVLCKVW